MNGEPSTSAGAPRTPAPTIYDVARLAGVSPSTVSRALSTPGRIGAKTSKRIADAAEVLGYQSNPMARALPTGRTRTFALILSDITNPVYFDVIRGAERVATENGYTLVIAETQESAEAELAIARRLQLSVDGIVLVASRLNDEAIGSLTLAKPIVLINRAVEGVPNITPDISTAVDAALTHLRDLGHSSICYASGPAASWMNTLRSTTICASAAALGITVVTLNESAPTIQGGIDAVPLVTAAMTGLAAVTAVLCFNDLMAMGVLRAADTAGIAVPTELSIVGFDDIFGADLTTPGLTTVRSPLGEAAERAMRLLIADTAGEQPPPFDRLTSTFIARGSSGPRSLS